MSVAGTALLNGAASLRFLTDVSGCLSVDLLNPAYDRTTQTVTFAVQLTNTSQDTLQGPLKGRIVSLSSALGKVELVGSNDHDDANRGVVDFQMTPGGGVLAPRERAVPKTLSFRVKGVRPFREGHASRFGLVSLKMRVFASLHGRSAQ